MIFLRYFPGFKGERQVSSTHTSSVPKYGLQSFHPPKRAIPFVWDGFLRLGAGGAKLTTATRSVA